MKFLRYLIIIFISFTTPIKADLNKNLILVTHYVMILEVLNYASSSGEIVVSDKNFNIIGTLEINF